ncbi:hypothetical protein [Legionella qingyii]|uniref:hypothetical protein n=1 Tax=Legionella qingyii TaxID=2184757 RepID=UPI000F8CCF0F|nr:hypothetical protein [Legionella qingyii]RUR29257.1 hypothetical protein ELY16_00215 [Legionella qingyii]
MKSLKELFKKISAGNQNKSTSSDATVIKSPDEKPVSNDKPLFAPTQPTHDFFSHPKMSDLAQVGQTKSLGYLPLELIRGSGFELFQVTQLLKKRGVKFFVIPNPTPEELYAFNPTKNLYVHIADKKEYKVIPKGGFSSIRSGALVAYDEDAVNAFLKENNDLINEENNNEPNSENHWPTEAADFVNMLFRKKAESAQMNYLVHKIFEEMPNQSNQDLTAK